MFTHLHLHTQYSLLDGFCDIKKLVARIKELGMDSCAITDHGVMFGVIDFYKECQKEGVKPILGCEVYMAERSRFDKDVKLDRNIYHLILLAENNTGYENLSKIVSAGYTDGFYFKPRVDFDVLKQYHEGIIALTACIAGRVPQRIVHDDIDGAERELDKLIEIFGKDNVYAEIQDHGLEQEKKINEHLIPLARKKGIKIVATNDSHYIYQGDAEAHDILLCVQTATTIDDPKRMRFPNDQFYVKSEKEMSDIFSYIPEAIANTQEVAQRCNVDIEFGHYHLPHYDLPAEFDDSGVYLRYLCEKGLERKYPTVTEELLDRLNYELGVINKMGFDDYFLIVADYINYAKNNNIPVGPGRGSAAGSLVAYSLNITEVDPIRYNLVFERFLNPGRVSMPDIDVDFADENRQDVIDYVTEKYGADCVCQIVTFGTMQAKQAIRDVGRSLGMSYSEVDKVAKEVPNRIKVTIQDALDESAELREMIQTNPNIAKLIDISRQLEGCPRHSSIHASGIVISDRPVREFVPMVVIDGSLATQFNMTTIEELGLLKMDFLGLRNLTVIKDTVENVKISRNIDLDMNNIPFNDPNAFKLISSGNTEGVFQLESSGMKSFMQKLQPDNIEDIIAGISLYRPGPMQYIDTYVNNKHNPQQIQYTCEALVPILNVTYGCMVYQEQVMQIVRDLAGFSMSDSDNVRKAMSKKKTDKMIEYRKYFIDGSNEKHIPGCIANGIHKDTADKIYDEMMDFAKYAFNKSHAACYAVVCFQTAYLKYYFPVEYMAALLSSVMNKDDKIKNYIRELRDMNIELLSPDVNESRRKFTVVNGKIRYGLLAVKALGSNAVDEIIRIREEKGFYKDFYDFVSKVEFTSINKRGVENLIKCGAFDSLGHTRKELLSVFAEVIDAEIKHRKKEVDGQGSLLDIFNNSDNDDFIINRPKQMSATELEQDELLQYEKESMGLYISGHPLKKYEDELKGIITHDSITLNLNNADDNEDSEDERFIETSLGQEQDVTLKDGDYIISAGIINTIKSIVTKSGKPMAFVTLEDAYGSFEVTVFSSTYDKYSHLLKKDTKVLVKGRVQIKNDSDILISAQMIADLEDPKDIANIRPIHKNQQNKDKTNNQQQKYNYAKRSLEKNNPYQNREIHNNNITKDNNNNISYEDANKPTKIKLPENSSIVISLNEYVVNYLSDIKNVLLNNNGDIRVILYDRRNGKKYSAPKNMWVSDDISVIDQLKSLVGEENIKVV